MKDSSTKEELLEELKKSYLFFTSTPFREHVEQVENTEKEKIIATKENARQKESNIKIVKLKNKVKKLKKQNKKLKKRVKRFQILFRMVKKVKKMMEINS